MLSTTFWSSIPVSDGGTGLLRYPA